MPVSRLFYFMVIIAGIILSGYLPAPDTGFPKKGHDKAIETNHFTVSYSISLKSAKGNTGIGESYNGGIKTLFVNDSMARIRLVSLMRIQSIFVAQPGSPGQAVVITKESGKDKYKYYLNAREWKQYNRKYDSASCTLTHDSAVILDYHCRKAIITLKDGRSLYVFYTDSIRYKGLADVEPVFACIPGLVLQYSYKYKKGTITYTATAISRLPLDPGVFNVPAKGFVTRRFSDSPL